MAGSWFNGSATILKIISTAEAALLTIIPAKTMPKILFDFTNEDRNRANATTKSPKTKAEPCTAHMAEGRKSMAKTSLVIVESPAKAKTIGKYLGPGYQVKACMGHLRDLPKSTLGVDLEHDFEPVYKPIKGKEDIISDLKKSAKSADMVYLATDPDREGEAISWHLKQLLDLPDEKTRRVTFNEITKKVVQESIQEPRDIDQKLVDAQQARRILDRIVGYELSPLLWKKIRRGLSAGRVQSVATRMVDDRDREIEEFKPEEYWTLDANLFGDDAKKLPFAARYHGKDYPLSYLRTLAHLSREGVSTFRMSHFWKKRKALDYEYFKAAAQNRCL